jgi:hypothetical protein
MVDARETPIDLDQHPDRFATASCRVAAPPLHLAQEATEPLGVPRCLRGVWITDPRGGQKSIGLGVSPLIGRSVRGKNNRLRAFLVLFDPFHPGTPQRRWQL